METVQRVPLFGAVVTVAAAYLAFLREAVVGDRSLAEMVTAPEAETRGWRVFEAALVLYYAIVGGAFLITPVNPPPPIADAVRQYGLERAFAPGKIEIFLGEISKVFVGAFVFFVVLAARRWAREDWRLSLRIFLFASSVLLPLYALNQATSWLLIAPVFQSMGSGFGDIRAFDEIQQLLVLQQIVGLSFAVPSLFVFWVGFVRTPAAVFGKSRWFCLLAALIAALAANMVAGAVSFGVVMLFGDALDVASLVF